MNVDILTKHLYYNNCFLKNDITKKFAEIYFENKFHKYDLYHFYIFGIDRLNDIINNYEDDTYYSYILKHSTDKNFKLDNGEINFNNKSILKIAKLFTYIFIGEFKYKNLICNMFLKLNDDFNKIVGFSTDVDPTDNFFKKFVKYKKFNENFELIIDEEIKNNLINLIKHSDCKG